MFSTEVAHFMDQIRAVRQLRILLVSSAMILGMLLAKPAAAQQQDQSSAKSTASTKRKVLKTKGHLPMSGTDPNVRTRVTTSSPESAATLAGNKLKVKAGATAQGVCLVHIDNWTGAIVHIFLQGDYVGTAGPGGELYASIPKGPSLFYARIDLNQFDWIPLGPENFDCDGSSTFTITP
jgi:hypothetical protein